MKRIPSLKISLLLVAATLFLAPIGQIVRAQQQVIENTKVDAPVEPKAEGQDTTATTTNNEVKGKTNAHHGLSITFGTDGIDIDSTNQDEVHKKVARKLRKHLHGSTNGQPDVAIGQPITVPAGKTVEDAVSIFGGLTINGTVTDSAVCIMGPVTLGPNAVIEDELVVVGGNVTAAPTAKIVGEVVVVGGSIEASPEAEIWKSHPQVIGGPNFPHIDLEHGFFASGVLKLRPFPPNLWWVWCAAGVFFLMHLAVVILFPRPVQSCVGILEERPITAFFSGLLLLILFAPLLFLLCVSVVGILVIPFFIVGLMASLVFGKVAVYRFTGEQLGRHFHSALVQAPLMAMVVGTAIFYLFYMIPILGLVTLMFLTVLGLGTALLAIISGMRRETKPPAPIDPNAPPGTRSSETGSMSTPGVEDPLVYPRVGFWRRFFATLLDFIILIVVAQGIFDSGVVFVFLMFSYHMVMWGWKGTTIGGIIMGIKIYRIDGRPIDFPVAIVRSLASVLSFVVMCIGFFWAGWSHDKRSWHDLVAGTMIVQMPKGISLM